VKLLFEDLLIWRELIRILSLFIHILREPASSDQITDMLEANRFYIKTVVDIRQQILAGGGEMHSDCEEILLSNGSEQIDVWGASWNPISQEVFYESMVNLRPRQNRSTEILDPLVRGQVRQIIYRLLGGV
jgi:Protein of unknown function (DUF5674)